MAGSTDTPAARGATAPAAGAEPRVPTSHGIAELAAAARTCTGCGLYRDATQTVFGAGPPRAGVLIVGEQPGDREDLAGEPFVGPAGRLLDKALDEAAIDRDDVYVTHAVKHFKFKLTERRGELLPLPDDLPLPEPLDAMALATIHPSAVLRSPDRDAAFDALVADLKVVTAAMR